MEYILSMTFLTESGKSSTLSVSGVKSDLTKEKINSLMDLLIAKSIIATQSGHYVSKSSAKITERKVTKYTV